jgi:hypothetical protein
MQAATKLGKGGSPIVVDAREHPLVENAALGTGSRQNGSRRSRWSVPGVGSAALLTMPEGDRELIHELVCPGATGSLPARAGERRLELKALPTAGAEVIDRVARIS